jgi:hypothetical protein
LHSSRQESLSLGVNPPLLPLVPSSGPVVRGGFLSCHARCVRGCVCTTAGAALRSSRTGLWRGHSPGAHVRVSSRHGGEPAGLEHRRAPPHPGAARGLGVRSRRPALRFLVAPRCARSD